MSQRDELRELREACGVTGKELVAAIQEMYPRYDKTMLSKCVGEGYGVVLDPEALEMLYKRFAPDLLETKQKRRKDRHTLTDRITCRLERVEYEALQQAAEQSGLTMQQLVRSLLVDAMVANQYLDVYGKELTP